MAAKNKKSNLKSKSQTSRDEDIDSGSGDNNDVASGQSSSNYPKGASPEELGQVGMTDIDGSMNFMDRKIYTVFRAAEKEYKCPAAKRDNVSDQFTPQDDLLTMEKTCRDFFKLEEKIYDPESTNPRMFAAENWVQSYEKDKNVILAVLDQYKANILRMEHLYTVAENNSYSTLLAIPNQDSKEAFQTNILWTSRALKEWSNNWFIKRTPWSSTPLWSYDHWVPGLTGQMMRWMCIGEYREFDMRDIAIETMIKKVDMLEGVIDRLISRETVAASISNYVNLKEVLEQTANQKGDRMFTTKVIDSQMGPKLGVTGVPILNHTIEKEETEENKEITELGSSSYILSRTDTVEATLLVKQLSAVKSLFQELRVKSMQTMLEKRPVCQVANDKYPDIWKGIDLLAAPVYVDLDIMNELVRDDYEDFESPGRHCSVSHVGMNAIELKRRIDPFRYIIENAVIDVMVNQAILPKKGLNILDSMFNQLWEYGEKGPTIELPTWCQMAIDSINGFERSMMDAWSEVFDCWEREFITRLWNIEVDHHTANWERIQTKYVKTLHDHQHPFVPMSMMTLASIGGDTHNTDITPLKGVLTCPGHLEKLMRAVCVQYRVFNIAHLARNFRSDVKSLCQWMVAAIEAIGMKQAAISAVMSDPTLNGDCNNEAILQEINVLRDRNSGLLAKVEEAYSIYQDVYNIKNKKEYDEEIALKELQPNKYSNEDQLNMTSSVQNEAAQTDLASVVDDSLIDIQQLKPWNHLYDEKVIDEAGQEQDKPQEEEITPEKIEITPVDDRFGEFVKTITGFEAIMWLKDNI